MGCVCKSSKQRNTFLTDYRIIFLIRLHCRAALATRRKIHFATRTAEQHTNTSLLTIASLVARKEREQNIIVYAVHIRKTNHHHRLSFIPNSHIETTKPKRCFRWARTAFKFNRLFSIWISYDSPHSFSLYRCVLCIHSRCASYRRARSTVCWRC